MMAELFSEKDIKLVLVDGRSVVGQAYGPYENEGEMCFDIIGTGTAQTVFEKDIVRFETVTESFFDKF